MTAKLDMNRIPQHIAIIMDGNGRWAMERGKERTFGHQAGVEAVRRILNHLCPPICNAPAETLRIRPAVRPDHVYYTTILRKSQVFRAYHADCIQFHSLSA